MTSFRRTERLETSTDVHDLVTFSLGTEIKHLLDLYSRYAGFIAVVSQQGKTYTIINDWKRGITNVE